MSTERLYKTLAKDDFESMGLSCERSYSYSYKGREFALSEVPLKNSKDPEHERMLEDKRCVWDYSEMGACLKVDVDIENSSKIFGSNGVAYSDSRIGVGIEWKAETSKIRHHHFLGSFENNAENISFNADLGELDFTSNVTFRLVFFVDRPGTPSISSPIGNEKGLVIGELTLCKIFVSGGGTMFPILLNADEKNRPLWAIRANFSDPCIDDFTDSNVAIILSQTNSGYQYIDSSNSKYNERFLVEVLASSFFALLLSIKAQYDDGHVDYSLEGEKGSIQSAMVYFKEALGFDVNSDPAQLANKVLSFIEKEAKKL